MNKVEITGANYCGSWVRTRTACRGIVLRDDQILLTYDTKIGLWMIPGGGMEPDETDKDCCTREVSEETGVVIEPEKCFLELVEYYTDWKWVNRYYTTRITGTSELHLTDREKEYGTEPRWIPYTEALEIFGNYEAHAETFLMKRNIYLREYTALLALQEFTK